MTNLDEPVGVEPSDEEAELLDRLEQLRDQRGRRGTASAESVARATAEPDTGDDGVAEFNTTKVEPVMFRLDGQEMWAAGAMPAGFMLDVLENRSTLRNTDRAGQMRIILDMLRNVLYPNSHAVVQKRMYDPENPIEFETIIRIVNYLTGEVYRRPTRRSSGSSGERSTTGTISTDGAQPGDLTPGPSPTTEDSSI